MGHQSQVWRSASGSRAWLSRLVEAMESAARPELRNLPCDGKVLAAVHAQLSRPAAPYAHLGSHFSLRN